MDKTVKISHENSLSKVGNIISLTNKLLNINNSNIDGNSVEALNEFEEDNKESKFIMPDIVDDSNFDEVIEKLIAAGSLTRVCTCGKCGTKDQNNINLNHKCEEEN
jgi:hypothetical protein